MTSDVRDPLELSLPLRTLGRALVLGVATLMPLATTTTAHGTPRYGPDLPFTDVLIGQYPGFVSLRDSARIVRSKHGYVYQAGQQDSRLVVTPGNGSVRFEDRGTRKLRSLPASCRRAGSAVGIAATCAVPQDLSERKPVLLEIWPRLGDDRVTTRALPPAFQVAVLGDDGRDVIRLGPGDDFVNGAMKRDRIRGGRGSDWIRSGIGNDLLRGGPGDDRLVGQEDVDTVRGGDGDDAVEGGTGSDVLYSGSGDNRVLCGDGRDAATTQAGDRTISCERLNRY